MIIKQTKFINLQHSLTSLNQIKKQSQTPILQGKRIKYKRHQQKIPIYKDMHQKNTKNHPKSKHLSSSVINYPSKNLNQSKSIYDHANQSMDAQLLKQSTKQLQNYLFHPNNNNNRGKDRYGGGVDNDDNNARKIIDYDELKNHQTSHTSAIVANTNINNKTGNYYDLSDSQRSRHYEQENQHSHQTYYHIEHSQNYEEQDQQHPPPNRSKSARNLRNLNEQKLKISLEMVDNNRNGQQYPSQYYSKKEENKNLNQNLQHKAIYQNFRQSDLNFLSDQQFLPLGMYPQERMIKKSSSKNTSKKSDSHHPVFRQTLNYVESGRNNNLRQTFMNFDAVSRRISDDGDDSSQQSIPLTNVDSRPSYRARYKKYKLKHTNAIQVIKQLQTLNETLINDQRQNFHYYEETIKDLENLLMIKDKQIDELNHLLLNQNHDQRRLYQGACSIDGRQMEFQNQKLKKELENKTKEINKLLKQQAQIANSNVSESSSVLQQKKEASIIKNLQKKYDLIKKQKESLIKKIGTLEDLNKMYELKLKEKEERLNKLSELNSDLQQQIIKLKGKMRSDETYDTERSVENDLPKRNKNQHLTFSTETFNKYPIVVSQPKLESPSEIEKYLACIDQQLLLIRTSMKEKVDESEKEGKPMSQFKKRQMSELDSVSQFEFDESSKNKLQFKALQNVVQKLSNFRASMGV